MNIDWTAFTPRSALTGGSVIGIAAAILTLVNGSVAGIGGVGYGACGLRNLDPAC